MYILLPKYIGLVNTKKNVIESFYYISSSDIYNLIEACIKSNDDLIVCDNYEKAIELASILIQPNNYYSLNLKYNLFSSPVIIKINDTQFNKLFNTDNDHVGLLTDNNSQILTSRILKKYIHADSIELFLEQEIKINKSRLEQANVDFSILKISHDFFKKNKYNLFEKAFYFNTMGELYECYLNKWYNYIIGSYSYKIN